MNAIANKKIHSALQKIFKTEKSRKQLFFAGIGFLLGFMLMIASLYVYLQIRKTFSNETTLPNYLILSKEVTLLNVLGASRFSESELAELQKQPFTEKLGIFQSGNFKVWAYGNDFIQFQTELFFEAVADEFLMKLPPKWNWTPESKYVPVIIPKDFVDQYNFVYAPSQGLPLLSESILPTLPTIQARIYTNRGERIVNLRIAGFEERIPSILVPESFLKWANETIGIKDAKSEPARIVLKVKNPASPELAKYLQEKNYQVSKEKTIISQIAGQVVEVIGIIGVLGVAFVLLALVIITLTFKLILSEAQNEIALLLQLGYTHKVLANYLVSSFLRFILLYGILGIFLAHLTTWFFYDFMQKRGVTYFSAFEVSVSIFEILFLALITTFNIWNIRKMVSKY
ncbi:MAG: FtsX-like permease family protein [Raineya sp.]|nr:hypothetical protein [Raineya sp.]MDW8297324.1 FtsX-like permease family protein [Raineya sp.]